MDGNRRKAVRLRLWVTGLVVAGGSVAASLLLTHLAFHFGGGVDYRTAMTFATIIPLCIAPIAYSWNARLNWKLTQAADAMRRLALTDQLTGLANRRSIMETLDRWNGAGTPISLVLVDVDHFKAINDAYGHATGDAALIQLSVVLRQVCHEDWAVARIGGEEFVIARQGPGLDALKRAVCEIRDAMIDTPIVTGDGPVTVTASFGIAEGGPEDHVDTLLRRADEALYKAKDTGRNRMVVCAA